MKNNITLIGVNFYPEETAIGLYSTQMVEYLSSNGYEVSVVTGFPYYPQWKILDSYRNKPSRLTEKHENLSIYRYKQYVPSTPTFKNRIVHLLDFTFGSIPNLLKIKKCNLVICVVPFTTVIVLGLLLSKLRGAKVWVHIQDFEFDAAVESGLAGKQKRLKTIVFDALFWIEKKLLAKVDIVSTISYGMIKKLETKVFTHNYFFPNWVDEDFINPVNSKQHNLMQSNKFKVLYSGNIGTKQSWSLFLRVVNYFKEYENIEFIVVGAGAKKDWLVEQTKHIKNVKHYMPIAYEELSNLLCSADLHILFQKNDVVDAVMPSKLLGMMASSKPSIVTGNLDSEVAKVLSQSQGGCFFDSNDFKNIVNTIELFVQENQELILMGQNARKYIVDNFSSKIVLKNFGTKVHEILNSKK